MELTALTPELLARFQQRKLDHMRPRLQIGLLVGAALFVVFAGWEWVLDPEALRRSWHLRSISAGSLVALFLLARVRRLQPWLELILYAGVAVSAAGIAALWPVLPESNVNAIGSLVLVTVVVGALEPPLRTALVSYAVMLVTAHVGLFAVGAGAFTFFALDVLVFSAVVAASVMSRVSHRIDLRAFQLEATLEQLATTDALSGVFNRRAFESTAAQEVERARRHGDPLSLLLIDIDHFKAVNDRYGHPVGDAVIRGVAQALAAAVRATDVVGRLGGEEFGVLLPHTEERAARFLAERLRQIVSALAVPVDGGGGGEVKATVSVGVATLNAGAEALPQVVSRADAALYAAKHGGRNRVVAAVVA